MVEAIVKNQSRQMPVSAYLQGEYGLKDIFIGVPTRLGSSGVERILELNLTDAERTALQTSAESVRQSLQRASSMLNC
jgi:malate dehydrogenase